jgi:protein involved in sex pheromone biosynthesis
MLKKSAKIFGWYYTLAVSLHQILKSINKMKKFATILVIGAVAFISSCGPSAQEVEEKRIADSIRVADSMAMVMAEQQRVADSVAKAQIEAAHKDSIAQGWLNEDGTPTAKLKKELKKK